jgi:hypothetical protein
MEVSFGKAVEALRHGAGEADDIERDVLATLHRRGAVTAMHGKDLLATAGGVTADGLAAGLCGSSRSGRRTGLPTSAATRSPPSSRSRRGIRSSATV